MTLTKMDLARYIEANQIKAELIKLPVQTPTVETAARAVGTDADCIIKSLLFLVAGKPVLAIVNGNHKIERRMIAAHFAVGRKRVKMADAETVLTVTGYPVGTVPPFGHLQPLQTLIDVRVRQQASVFGGGGEVDTLLHTTPQEIKRFTQAVELELTRAEAHNT